MKNVGRVCRAMTKNVKDVFRDDLLNNKMQDT